MSLPSGLSVTVVCTIPKTAVTLRVSVDDSKVTDIATVIAKLLRLLRWGDRCNYHKASKGYFLIFRSLRS